MIENQDLFLKFLSALIAFYDKDFYLIEKKVAERALTHKLAEHMQQFFPDYDVDCEYNKIGDDPKRVDELISQFPKSQKQFKFECTGNCDECHPNKCVIFPDIIVHNRGTEENFVVVEAKTGWSNASRNNDFAKLDALTGSGLYHYKLGISIAFNQSLLETIKSIMLFGLDNEK